MADTRNANGGIIVVGGGIMGLSIAWQLARRGRAVQVFERERAGHGASWIAAGMLAPQAEAGFEEAELLQLGEESLQLYPRFLQELEEDSGIRVALRRSGTLMVGFDADDEARLRRLHTFRTAHNLPGEWIQGEDLRRCEPLLAPEASVGLWIEHDAQVDNRALVDAVRQALLARGGALHEHTGVDALWAKGSRIQGVRVGGCLVHAETVVLAAGCWSKTIGGLAAELTPPVRPVKGQIVALRTDERRPLQRMVRAPDVYIAEKGDGRVLLGASSEEVGFDTRPTAGPVMKLLEHATEAIPSLRDHPLVEFLAGLRPGSRDHSPLIGDSGVSGLYFATGHHRNGILLAPATAFGLVDALFGAAYRPSLIPFSPTRFH
ncbi:MAG: glycine oxidase ThiO [Nitrospirae bacterium]|nr:glycine oxidase ThiO [Nitrospirota bacterium]